MLISVEENVLNITLQTWRFWLCFWSYKLETQQSHINCGSANHSIVFSNHSIVFSVSEVFNLWTQKTLVVSTLQICIYQDRAVIAFRTIFKLPDYNCCASFCSIFLCLICKYVKCIFYVLGMNWQFRYQWIFKETTFPVIPNFWSGLVLSTYGHWGIIVFMFHVRVQVRDVYYLYALDSLFIKGILEYSFTYFTSFDECECIFKWCWRNGWNNGASTLCLQSIDWEIIREEIILFPAQKWRKRKFEVWVKTLHLESKCFIISLWSSRLQHIEISQVVIKNI